MLSSFALFPYFQLYEFGQLRDYTHLTSQLPQETTSQIRHELEVNLSDKKDGEVLLLGRVGQVAPREEEVVE